VNEKGDPIAGRAEALLLCGFDGTTADGMSDGLLAECAGVVLFARNLETAEQSAALTSALRKRFEERSALPPIVAIDEEGGTVSRIGAFGTAMPSAMALGATGDPQLTHDVYKTIGEELTALGVTLDFAPVADANTNPRNPVIGVRSFGDQPIASMHVPAAIAGLHDAGVAAAAKHFPGHGDASVDSHEALPVIEHGAARLREIELAPFRAAIAAGVDVVMAAHVAVPTIDPSGSPASLSRPVLTGLLREELGFDGVICTDCLEMGAIAGRYPPGEEAVLAIEAGADLVTYSSSADAVRAAVRAIRDAVGTGRLDRKRVERSIERVAKLRRGFRPSAAPPLASVGAKPHRDVALAAARRAMTIVRDPASILPLRLSTGDKIFLVQFADDAHSPAQTGKTSTQLGALLAKGPARVHEQVRSLEPAGHEYKQLLMAAASATVIVAVTRRAWAHPLQARAVGDLALAGKPLVVVAAREPYDASDAPAGAAVLAAYGDDAASTQATAEVLLGAQPALGKLPVTLDGCAFADENVTR